jgi:long-chain fatty acid transport protein
MRKTFTRLLPVALLLPALLAGANPAGATNGMFLTAYGAETAGRAGANIAISDRTLGLNFNPAGLGQLQGNHFTTNLSVLSPTLAYENGLNSTVGAEDRRFPMPAFAYVRAGRETPWAWGVGFIGQGGMGATFENLNTPFGTRDETFSEVRFGTLTPTVSYSFSDDMAIGAALNLGYADASFRFFPHTSFFNVQDPNQSFFGIDLHRAKGLQTSLRLGYWWRPDPRLSLGAIYQTKTRSKFEDGKMTVNFANHPFLQQSVRYTAEVDGFTFASQAGIGLAWRPTSPWVVALDVKRYFWDSAIDTIEVKAKDPSVAGAPPALTLPFVFNWKDQWVYALGTDYRMTDRLTLRAGYNHGSNPVPSGTLTPLFPATVERHATLGFGYLVANRTYDFALERAFNKRLVNDNLNPAVNPFGPGSCVDHKQWTLSIGVSWAMDR